MILFSCVLTMRKVPHNGLMKSVTAHFLTDLLHLPGLLSRVVFMLRRSKWNGNLHQTGVVLILPHIFWRLMEEVVSLAWKWCFALLNSRDEMSSKGYLSVQCSSLYSAWQTCIIPCTVGTFGHLVLVYYHDRGCGVGTQKLRPWLLDF